jgi:hypothetical protein
MLLTGGIEQTVGGGGLLGGIPILGGLLGGLLGGGGGGGGGGFLSPSASATATAVANQEQSQDQEQTINFYYPDPAPAAAATALGALGKPNPYTPLGLSGFPSAQPPAMAGLPGYASPGLVPVSAVAPSLPTVPAAGGGGGMAGGPVGNPAAAVMPWNVQGGDGGGGSNPFMNPAAIPALVEAMSRPVAQAQPGLSGYVSQFAPEGATAYAPGPAGNGTQMPAARARGGGSGLVPPPPPEMALLNGGAAPGAGQPLPIRQQVEQTFGALNPSQQYAGSGKDMTDRFEKQLAQEITAIDEKYAQSFAQARMQMIEATKLGNQYLAKLNSLPTDEMLWGQSALMGNAIANQQDREYSPLKQLAFGRVPQMMPSRSTRVSATAQGYFGRMVESRNQQAQMIKMGLDFARDQLKEAGNVYNDLLKQRNQEVQTATTMLKAYYGNEINFEKNKGADERGNARNMIAATAATLQANNKADEIKLEHQDRQERNQIAREALMQRAKEAADELAIKTQRNLTDASRARAYTKYVDAVTAEMPLRTNADRVKAMSAMHQATALITNHQVKDDVIQWAEDMLSDMDDTNQVAEPAKKPAAISKAGATR